MRRCTHSEIKIKATDAMLRKQPTTTTRLQHTFECIHRSTDAAPSLRTYENTVGTCVNMSAIELLGKEQHRACEAHKTFDERLAIAVFAPQRCPSLWVHQTDGWPDGVLSWGGKEQKRRKRRKTKRQNVSERDESERVRES